ncbi:MAG: hypothetical protein RLY87_1218 [Chloroflexota bacterium]|jgi:N-carbamoyl-L-amino-acid hydrolase
MPLSAFLDPALLHIQLSQLGAIGASATSPGRTRLALTDADKHGRDVLVGWLRELDLTVHIDQVGNIYGILEPAPADAHLPVFLMGSHIDTVVEAGAYDGCYGVLAGLAVLRAIRAAGITPPRPVGVVAFSNEEGVRFQPDMLGSLAVAGGISVAEVNALTALDGPTYGSELARIGYAGPRIPGSIPIHEYIELHIEQGPILAATDVTIGAVHTLQGISWQRVTISGKANHAGTTPLHLRHDPMVVAAQVIADLRAFARATESTVATVGMHNLAPNAINVIPHTATFTVDLRDPDDGALRLAESQLQELLQHYAQAEGVTVHCDVLARFAPVTFSADVVATITEVTRAHGISCRPMVSGAGHDAQMIARIAPSAMIFVPSRDGISHNPAEYTDPAHLEAGLRVLCDVVAMRLGIAP